MKKLTIAIFCVLLIAGIVSGCTAPTPSTPAVGPTLPEAAVTQAENQPGTTAVTQPVTVTAQSPVVPTAPATLENIYKPSSPVWGIELSALTKDAGLDLVKQAGAYWVRRNALLWSEIEPKEGERKWEAIAGLEGELQAAAAQGQQVILVVRSTPEWAQSTPGSKCSAPKAENLQAFASFLHEAVRRYSLPPYNVQYWEIGNEPDVAPELISGDSPFGCWGKTGDPNYGGSDYAQILKAVYPQIKSANPQAQVLVGGLLLDCDPRNPPASASGPKDCTPSRYLEGILANGGGDYFDGISFHAYDYYGQQLATYGNSNWGSAWDGNGPVLTTKAEYLRSLLDQYKVKGKYLLNTELALLCGRDGSEPICQSRDFLLSKSYYLAEAYAAAIADQLTANVWYSLTGWRGSGLVDSSMQPNQAYQALQTSSAQLGGAGYKGLLSDFPSIKGYIFERNGMPLWLIWSADGGEHDISLPAAPTSLTDVFGNSLPGSQQLKVTAAPLYVEFAKQ
jgi:hypothetical protein